jgi:hypothetical protein
MGGGNGDGNDYLLREDDCCYVAMEMESFN